MPIGCKIRMRKKCQRSEVGPSWFERYFLHLVSPSNPIGVPTEAMKIFLATTVRSPSYDFFADMIASLCNISCQ